MINYVSIKLILDNILDHPMMIDLSFERALNHTIHFIRIVGCPRIFEEKTAVVKIEDYRGVLPHDLNDIIQVRTFKTNKVFKYSLDSFHMSENKTNISDLTYKVLGNIIFTSMKNGSIEIAYNSFAVDEEGYPLIPDNSFFIRALELYIKKQHFTILFDLEKLNATIYNNTCLEYAWAVALAQTDLIRLSIDLMLSLADSLSTLIPGTKEYNYGFKNNSAPETIKKR